MSEIKEQHSVIKACINLGIDLQYGKVSLCDLRNYRYSNVKDQRRYQVHSDDYKNIFSKIYDDLDDAVYRFIDLKSKVTKIK